MGITINVSPANATIFSTLRLRYRYKIGTSQWDEKDFRVCQVYCTRCFATINGLPAQTLIIALIAAVLTIFLEKLEIKAESRNKEDRKQLPCASN